MPAITSEIAQTEFLNLLAIQLKNQDPINPVQQEDFISQLSQFSMLEEIEALNTSFEQVLRLQELTQGIELVGKNAEYFDPTTGQRHTGKVERLFADSGPADLLINGERISLALVSGVIA